MNEYGVRFYEIMHKYHEAELLCQEKIQTDFFVYRDDFPRELLIETLEMSKEKAKHVSRTDQNGMIRNSEKILVNVFKGIMAETIVHIFLLKKCGMSLEQIKRYDLERSDFKYRPDKEYDVALFKNGVFSKELGVKASKMNQGNLKDFVLNQHCIIGKYKYTGRTEDHNLAFYFGVITVYKDVYDEDTFINDYLRGDIHTYLVSGAPFSEMTGEFCSKNINMNQENTVYKLGLRSLYAGDVNDCKQKFLAFADGNPCVNYKFSRSPLHQTKAYAMLNDHIGLYHTQRQCPYIKNKENIIEFDSIYEAKSKGHVNCCKYCGGKQKYY